MDGVPSILSSAQSLLSRGFATLDRAASALSNSEAAPPTLAPAADPFLGGIIDLYSARESVSLGVTLLKYADPFDPTNSFSAEHPFDRYA